MASGTPDIAPHAPEGDDPSTGRVVAFPKAPARDVDLFEGLVAGRPRAMAELFDRYAPPVRRLLTRMLSDRAEADDLTQETLLVVVRRAGDLRGADAVRPFVMSIAVRIAKNELRRRRVRRWVGLDEGQPALLVGPHDAVTHERVERLGVVLRELGSNDRALFLLRHVEQLELAELATTFDCSLATIKRRLSKVNKRFSALARSDASLRELVEAP